MQEHADATVLFDNTALLKQLTAAAASASMTASHSSRPPARLCMRQLDAYVARCLAGLTFPTDGANGRRPFDPGDLVATTCPMPTLKCLSLHAAPTPALTAADGPGKQLAGHSLSSAQSVAAAAAGSAARCSGRRISRRRRARQRRGGAARYAPAMGRSPRGDASPMPARMPSPRPPAPTFRTDRPALTLAPQVIARGIGSDPPPFQHDDRSQQRLTQLLGASPCTPHPIDWKLSQSTATALPGSGAQRTLTLASNRSTAGPQLEQILTRARLQLLGRAYVHHYEKYGVGADFIEQRAELVQQVVDDYERVGKSLTSTPEGRACTLTTSTRPSVAVNFIS